MELPTIGAHCALETCNINDFLPIRCRCDMLFCKDHIAPETHSCALLRAEGSKRNLSSTQPKLQRCAVEKCSKPSLEAFIADGADTEGRTPAVCDRCKQAFCASHRLPASHLCTGPDPSLHPPRNEAAKAMLAQIFPAKAAGSSISSVSAKKKPPASSNPKKAAQIRQVELMKMRHRAQPADPQDKDMNVPIGERLHVRVLAENKDEMLFWFRKTMGTGKALDILASHLSMSSESLPLYLYKVADSEQAESLLLRNDKPLVDQIEDGSHLALWH